MKNLSEEKIEVGGKEYTLFLNRKGLVAWENETKDDQKKLQSIQGKYEEITNALDGNNVAKSDNDDPFKGLDEIDDLDSDTELTIKTFKVLYWIMLYTHHKMSRAKANEWFEEATKEYGIMQLIELGNQMLHDINVDFFSQNQDNLKKLKALRPTK